MARTKQTGPEIKLYQIDTMAYLTEKNIITKLAMFSKFVREGGVTIADNNIDLNRAQALERFEKNYKINDINNLTTIKGQANETWLRKSGLLNSSNGKYELSAVANAIYENRISLRDYCFLLLSKQWIVVKDPKKGTNYKENLLSFILQEFFSMGRIHVDNFVSHFCNKALDLHKEEYSDITLSNQEAARYLIEPLLISGLIEVSNNSYQIPERLKSLATDYVDKNELIKKIDEVNCDDEEYWNSFQYGVYDLINDTNINLYKEQYNNLFKMNKEYNNKFVAPLQQIYYGAPGTGKSNEIKRMTGDGTFNKDNTFRTTFHPDSDYSSFVGAYKPIWNGEKIIYDYRPQTFLKAYIAAWTNPNDNIVLVIEEINRGNCAQIFGDIFQLLDRESNGLSKYPIEADIDMQSHLSGKLAEIDEIYDGLQISAINKYYEAHYDNAFEAIKNGKILVLPMNLSILATMNTSDQSLFPMDSAFKRRWEWQYMPIIEGVNDDEDSLNWKIKLDDTYYYIDWWSFLKRINNVISDLTTSEDKKLGYFFCQPNDFTSPDKAAIPNAKPDLITAKHFVDKVIFYLWNDVFKDYAFDAKCCKGEDEKEILFAKFYNEDGKTVNIDILKHFFETLKDDTQESLVKTKSANTDSAVSNGDTIEELETQDTTTAEE